MPVGAYRQDLEQLGPTEPAMIMGSVTGPYCSPQTKEVYFLQKPRRTQKQAEFIRRAPSQGRRGSFRTQA